MKPLFKSLVSCAILAIASSPALQAEVRVTQDYDDQAGLTLFQMTVTPAPEPVPALKHRLQLRPIEYKPGNAATYYLRANAENGLSSTWKGLRDKYGDAIDDWYSHEVPLSELPIAELREAAAAFDYLVSSFIAPASERRDCDFGYNFSELRGGDVYALPLPEAQQSREICRLLALRTRLAIAEGRYDDAIDCMRMNYRLAQNVGQEPILVCGLVGVAEVGVTNSTVLELIAASDSPNLYWALTELQNPLVDMRRATSYEMSMISRVFPILHDAETAEHTAREWARLITQEMATIEDFTSSMAGTRSLGKHFNNPELVRGLAATGLAMVAYPGAKHRLLAAGMDPERVERMPVGQVLAIDTAREYQRIADGTEKWWYLPYPLARHRMREAEQILLSKASLEAGLAPLLADMLMPAVRAGRNAQERIEWQLKAFQVIEALRMHAAETGSFPHSLDRIQLVPVPQNPVTDQPYLYRLIRGQTAVLELPFSDGMPGVAYRYELKLEATESP